MPVLSPEMPVIVKADLGGGMVVGAGVVGARVVGTGVVGIGVVGAKVVGTRVVGTMVVGTMVVGTRVVGTMVVGNVGNGVVVTKVVGNVGNGVVGNEGNVGNNVGNVVGKLDSLTPKCICNWMRMRLTKSSHKALLGGNVPGGVVNSVMGSWEVILVYHPVNKTYMMIRMMHKITTFLYIIW